MASIGKERFQSYEPILESKPNAKAHTGLVGTAKDPRALRVMACAHKDRSPTIAKWSAAHFTYRLRIIHQTDRTVQHSQCAADSLAT
jgi:hypothetical protein